MHSAEINILSPKSCDDLSQNLFFSMFIGDGWGLSTTVSIP